MQTANYGYDASKAGNLSYNPHMHKKLGLMSFAMALPSLCWAQSGNGFVELGIGARFEFTWTIESNKEGPKLPLFSCERVCQGKKHTVHENCDMSCDKACAFEQGQHYTVLLAERNQELGEEDAPPLRSHPLTIGGDMDRLGLPSGMGTGLVVSRFLQPATASLKPERLSLGLKCWNQTPCSSSTAFVNSRRLVVRIDYELVVREGDRVVARGAKRSLRWAVFVPPPLNKDRVITTSDPAVSCKCEVVQKAPSETGFIPGYRNEGEFAFCEDGGVKRVATGQMIGQMVTEISVQNMNRATFTVAPGHGRCVIPAGWELECLDDGQDVQLQEDLVIQLMPWEQKIHAWLAPVTVRTACLEINKPEPTPNMRYRFMPPSRPSLARLARGVRASSFRGPWDQARLWIATDFASHTKIREVMLPAPSRRTYLYEMYNAATAMAISPADPRVLAIMDLSLLHEPKNDGPAAAWLLTSKMRAEGPKTLEWLKSNANAFHTLLSDPTAARYMAELAASVIHTFGDQGIEQALLLVTSCVPPDQRRAVAAESEMVAVQLTTTDSPTVATKLLNWMETTRPPFAGMVGLNVSESLPEPIRKRAAMLANK